LDRNPKINLPKLKVSITKNQLDYSYENGGFVAVYRDGKLKHPDKFCKSQSAKKNLIRVQGQEVSFKVEAGDLIAMAVQHSNRVKFRVVDLTTAFEKALRGSTKLGELAEAIGKSTNEYVTIVIAKIVNGKRAPLKGNLRPSIAATETLAPKNLKKGERQVQAVITNTTTVKKPGRKAKTTVATRKTDTKLRHGDIKDQKTTKTVKTTQGAKTNTKKTVRKKGGKKTVTKSTSVKKVYSSDDEDSGSEDQGSSDDEDKEDSGEIVVHDESSDDSDASQPSSY